MIWPACCRAYSEPEPSPALVTNVSAVNPLANGATMEPVPTAEAVGDDAATVGAALTSALAVGEVAVGKLASGLRAMGRELDPAEAADVGRLLPGAGVSAPPPHPSTSTATTPIDKWRTRAAPVIPRRCT